MSLETNNQTNKYFVPKCSFGFSILNVKLGYLNTLKVKKKTLAMIIFYF
jgi:hypothetical protein